MKIMLLYDLYVKYKLSDLKLLFVYLWTYVSSLPCFIFDLKNLCNLMTLFYGFCP